MTINWATLTTHSPLEELIVEFSQEMTLMQAVDFPTSFSGTLDLVFLTRTIDLRTIRSPPTSINSLTNHYPVTLEFSHRNDIQTSSSTKSLFRCYCKADYERLNKDLQNNPFTGHCWSNPNVLVK